MPPIPGRIFPVDPTIGSDDPQYRWGVVVRIECGSASNEVLVFVEDDRILNGQDVIDRAIEDYRNGENQGPYSPPPPVGDSSSCVYSGRIVQVGRRSDVPMFPGR